MDRAFLTFQYLPSNAVRDKLGADLDRVAVLALRALLVNKRGIEVAHQQIRYREIDLAFSSRVTSAGELVLELDVGDPKFRDRVVLEDDIRKSWQARGLSGEPRRRPR